MFANWLKKNKSALIDSYVEASVDKNSGLSPTVLREAALSEFQELLSENGSTESRQNRGQESEKQQNESNAVDFQTEDNGVLLWSIFEATPDALFLIADEKKILHCNNAALEMFKCTKSDFLALSPNELIETTCCADFATLKKMVDGNGHYIGELDLTRADGTQFPGEMTIQTFCLNNREYAFYSIRDITKKRANKRAIEKSERMFRNLAESMNAMVLVSKIDNNGKAPECLFANQKALDWTEYTLEEFKSDTPPTILTDEGMAMLDNYHQMFHEGKEIPQTIEVEIVSKSGKHRWIETSWDVHDLGPDGILKMTTSFDITSRKKAELELLESETKFKALAEATNAVITIAAETPTGYEFTYANKAAIDTLGFPWSELKKMDPLDLFSCSCEHTQEQLNHIKDHYRDGKKLPASLEMKIVTQTGEERWFESTGKFISLGGRMVDISTSFDITDRKKAEQALKESEKNFRVLADSTSAQIAITMDKGKKFVFANKTLLDKVGMTLPEFLKLNPIETLPKAAREAGEIARNAALKENLTSYKFEYQAQYGDKQKWVETTATQTKIDGQDAVIWTSYDISDHKKAQAALAQSEEKFRNLAETTTAQIMVVQEDKFLYANKAALDHFGMDWETFSAHNPHDVIPEDVHDISHDEWVKAQSRGENSIRFEFSEPQKDGSLRWYEGYGTQFWLDGVASWITTAFDITDHKNALAALSESENKYRTIFDTAGTCMIIFGDDAIIALTNAEFEQLTGYKRSDVEGKMSWKAFFQPSSLRIMEHYHELRSHDPSAAPKTYEAQVVDINGMVHDGIVNINMIPNTKLRVASFQDLTEKKRAEQQMYRADKMAALGQIIAGVAHEINNPNNFIFFNLPILKRYIESIRPLLEHHLVDEPDLKILNMPYTVFLEDVFKLIENMEHGSKRISGIVSELKNYIRNDESKDLVQEKISVVINHVMTLIGKQVRKMVKHFEMDIQENLPLIDMNPGKMEQVIINLVINAGQAADKDESMIKLRACLSDDNWVEISVEDNGQGIPQSNIQQIFEPFYTSKGRDAGTGLGLSISHKIAEDHGGTLTVKSELGVGSTFTLRLPVARPHIS